MANGFQGPPAVDFYSMLSGLGDTIAKNRQESAIASAFQPGADGKVDYGQALGTVARYNPTLAVSMQNHLDQQKQQEIETARAAKNDEFSHGIQSENLKLSRARGAREAADFENTPDQFAPNPKAGQPGEPQYIDQYAQAAAAAGASKPIPFETLSGTKYLLRQPDGSYTTLDPATIGQPQQARPAPQPQPAPAPVVGGPQPQPAPVAPPQPVASAQPPAQPGQPAEPANLNALDPQTGRREAWLKVQDPAAQDYIRKVADYQIDPRTSSTKGGHREQIMSAVAQYDPTYDQNTFGSRSKAIKDFSTGAQGNSIRSFDVATDHLDTLQKYVEAAKNGDYRVINSLRQKWLQETGSPLPTNIQAVAPIVGAEVSKAIIGSNNALADREELRKPLNGANSPDQLMGAIQAYKALMTGQLKGLSKQYEDTTGKKDFNNRLRENTRSVLLGGDKTASDTSGSQPNTTSTGIKWSIQ